jgi:AraC-like DNA-binding protein
MKILQTFSDIPGYFNRFPAEFLPSGKQEASIPYDKLPYDNNSGLYFNYILDFRTGEMVFLSKRFIELTGYGVSFFKQGFAAWQEIIHPKDRMAVLKSVSVHTEALLKIGTEEQINNYSDNSTLRISTRYGTLLKLLRQRLYIAQDSAGNFLYEAGIFIDISSLRNDGNLRLLINAPDGSRYLEYYPKEDACPRIYPVRERLADLKTMALQPNNKFLCRVQKILTEKYADAEFEVKSFGKHLNISRSQLYRQLEKHACISPNRLIRIFRLHQSLEYLAQNEMSISEVAWSVGFNNASWFSKCFYEEFDCTPSDYRNLMR